MSPLDGVRSEIAGLRNDMREDVAAMRDDSAELNRKIDAFIACYSAHHTETRERIAALEAISEPTPASKSRVKRYAPHAGILSVLLAVAIEAGPAIANLFKTKDATAQTTAGK